MDPNQNNQQDQSSVGSPFDSSYAQQSNPFTPSVSSTSPSNYTGITPGGDQMRHPQTPGFSGPNQTSPSSYSAQTPGAPYSHSSPSGVSSSYQSRQQYQTPGGFSGQNQTPGFPGQGQTPGFPGQNQTPSGYSAQTPGTSAYGQTSSPSSYQSPSMGYGQPSPSGYSAQTPSGYGQSTSPGYGGTSYIQAPPTTGNSAYGAPSSPVSSTSVPVSESSFNVSTTNYGDGQSPGSPDIQVEDQDQTVDVKTVSYRCGDCQAIVYLSNNMVIRCKACGFRILYKLRNPNPIQYEAV